ncbi:DUF6099 family protein [Kitasatospora terrestris]|uniref:Uncharacterized protein n=1 Tax=Kitasatospora terrestris TaxID=258051 RepID=A0ABP9DJJ6_9ACTN
MDALRLIKTARHALAEARSVPDTLHEAWQTGLLTEALGARIAEREGDGEEYGTLGQLLCDAGGHAASCLDQPPEADPDGLGGDWSGGGRVERLGELGELEPVLAELAVLLNEASETLVVLACGADTESLYWCCIDGVDATAECKDLVAELLRAVRREAGVEPPDEDAGADGRAAGQSGEPSADAEGRGGAGCCGGGGGGGGGGGDGDAGCGGCCGAGGAGSAGGGGAARRAERATLVVPLGPPVGGAGDRAPDRVPAQAREECSPDPLRSPVRAAEERRSESSPARSVLIEASSSCICSSRLVGGVGAPAGVPAGVPAVVGGSVQGSDIRGPFSSVVRREATGVGAAGPTRSRADRSPGTTR